MGKWENGTENCDDAMREEVIRKLCPMRMEGQGRREKWEERMQSQNKRKEK